MTSINLKSAQARNFYLNLVYMMEVVSKGSLVEILNHVLVDRFVLMRDLMF